MPPTSRAFRVAALAGSALLMGAFVAYRAGAFDRRGPTAAPPATAPTPAIDLRPVEFLGGSKSDMAFPTAEPGTPAPAPAPPAQNSPAPDDGEYFPGVEVDHSDPAHAPAAGAPGDSSAACRSRDLPEARGKAPAGAVRMRPWDSSNASRTSG